MSNIIFESWLNSNKISEPLKEEFKAKTSADIDYYFDSEYKFKFGTSGVRLLWGEGTRRFNKITYTQLFLGFIKFLETQKSTIKRIVMGRDNRHGSREMLEYAASLFSSFGYEVLVREDYQMLSTPITSFLINEKQASAGLMITSSHNPKEYNGFKVYLQNGAQPLVDDTNKIEKLTPDYLTALNYEFEPNPELIKFLTKEDIDVYFETIKSKVILQNSSEPKDLKVVFSGHHGSTTVDMIDFLKSLGYDVISVKEQNFEDPDFINDVSSNPEDPVSFQLSEKYAAESDADVMVASDPDGDRMAVAIKHNDEWRYINGNQAGILISYYLLQNKEYEKQKYIISTYISTRYPELFKKDFDVEVEYVGVGFKHHGNMIADNKKNKDLVVAFEEAIGSIPSDINNDKDSYQVAALLLEIIEHYKKQNMTLIDVLNQEIFAKYGNWNGTTVQFTIEGDNWKAKGQEIISTLQNFEYNTITEYEIKEIIYHQEGSYLEWKLGEYSSIKFRLSGTEPKFKIYIDLYIFAKDTETNYHEELKTKIEDIIDFFKNYLGL